MTLSSFCQNPGRALDSLRRGSVVPIKRYERDKAPIATLTGVLDSTLDQRTCAQCQRSTADLRLGLRDGPGFAITRNGMIEAEIRPVRA